MLLLLLQAESAAGDVIRRHLRLNRPEAADLEYSEATMDRECRRLGAGGVSRSDDGTTLLLDTALGTGHGEEL